MDFVIRVDSPSGSRDLTRADLQRLAEASAGEMTSVPFRAIERQAPPSPGVTHATFHAADGYAASIPIEQARADGVVLVPPPSANRLGVRLVVSEGHTTCLNVKAVTRVELTEGPGRHTVDPNPHTPARVTGWDES